MSCIDAFHKPIRYTMAPTKSAAHDAAVNAPVGFWTEADMTSPCCSGEMIAASNDANRAKRTALFEKFAIKCEAKVNWAVA